VIYFSKGGIGKFPEPYTKLNSTTITNIEGEVFSELLP